MTAVIIYDDTNIDLIPEDAEAVFYYVDGKYKETSTIKARCPKAALIGIAVNPADAADGLDVEPGDATIADIFYWLKAQLARKVSRPVKAPFIYISVSDIDSMMVHMDANGFKHGTDFLIVSAHYDAGEHVCGPDTCKETSYACDATQWTDTADGKSLDQTAISSSFLAASVAPAAPPKTSTAPAAPKVTLTINGVKIPLTSGKAVSLTVEA